MYYFFAFCANCLPPLNKAQINMSGNTEDPGTSMHMSVEEQAREHNKSFWQSPNEEMEDAEDASGERGDDDYGVSEHEGREDDDTTDGGDHTTDGGDHTASGSGTNPTAEKKAAKPRKDRKPQVLANVTDEFTLVSECGLPLEPKDKASGFSHQIGCIVRESVSINTKDIRSKENAALLQTMLDKLHQRYKFPDEDSKKRAESNAITTMSTALSSWRFRVKKKIDKGDSWEKISKKEPHLSKEDFDALKESFNTKEAKIWSTWGREMQALNIGKHHLGSGGYRGKQPTWDREDKEYIRLGKENPWYKITDIQTRNYVRSRYFLNWKTGEFVTNDPAVQDFEKKLVRNLITAYISG